jgi:hypothetical protein
MEIMSLISCRKSTIILCLKVKVKVKLSLCLTKHHAMKYWEWRCRSTHSLITALDESECSASRTGRFTPRERTPGTHWIGDWVGSQSQSGHGVEQKNSHSLQGTEPRLSDSPARSQSLYRLSYPEHVSNTTPSTSQK